MEEEFSYKPTSEEVKVMVINWYNQEINNEIMSGFTYNGIPVWLSQENQFNYKSAYDLAVQTDGTSLPVRFKFGTDDEPVYYEFNTLENLTDFYTKEMVFVQRTISPFCKSLINSLLKGNDFPRFFTFGKPVTILNTFVSYRIFY